MPKKFFKKSSVFYINTFLSIVAILFVINVLGLPGHTLIKRAMATVAGIAGEGTVNYVARFATGANPSNSLGDSIIYDDGTNVGIGTTNPQALEHISKSVANATAIAELLRVERVGGVADGTGANRAALISFTDGANTVMTAAIGGVRVNPGTSGYGNLAFYVDGLVGGTTDVSALTEAMRIDSNGNVGIGTVSPGAPLEVNGAVKLTPLASDPGTLTNGMMWMRQ